MGIQVGDRLPELQLQVAKPSGIESVSTKDLFAGKKPAMPPEDPAAFKRAAREEDKTRQGKLV